MHVKWDGDGDEAPKTILGQHEWIKFENKGVFKKLISNPFLENVGYIHGSILQALFDYKRDIAMLYGPSLNFQSKNFNGEHTETLQSVIPERYSSVQEYVASLTEWNHGRRSFNTDDFYKLLPEEKVGYFTLSNHTEEGGMLDEWVEKLGVFDPIPTIMKSTVNEEGKLKSIFFCRSISFGDLFEPEKLLAALAIAIGLTTDEFSNDDSKSFRKTLEEKFEGIELDDDDYTRIEL